LSISQKTWAKRINKLYINHRWARKIIDSPISRLVD
jgi:hypothetical protein